MESVGALIPDSRVQDLRLNTNPEIRPRVGLETGYFIRFHGNVALIHDGKSIGGLPTMEDT